MRKRVAFYCLLVVAFVFITCKKPFDPTVQAQAKSYLVVEGLINTGNDSTIIKVSRTVNVPDSTRVKAETGAKVRVIDDAGNNYALTEADAGRYVVGPLSLSPNHKYSLNIITNSGTEYQSEMVEVKNAPPIDTIGYRVRNNGLEVNVTSHDPSKRTQYYRWEYNEDWQFHAKYHSFLIVKDDTVVHRTPEEDIYYCFNKAKSTNILIGSSVKLTSDIMSEAPISIIPKGSLKISMRYSVLVREYALSREAYLFYENLKKNTEQLGSIFDALPSEISGNIHNVNDPKEPVIGYILAGTYSQKRRYINKSELPGWEPEYPASCKEDSTRFVEPFSKPVEIYILSGLTLPTTEMKDFEENPEGVLIGYMRTDFICGDCTLTGTKKRPDFWKDN
ncbi:DUF4249 domain-containing protein [Mucilaginibacter litoreus]|uniref:DUF4249 domain-containing protein n=1 Tax=Mucilaginibacter litoreus TaxID=1048221 RepID=A0ABW3AWE4_9SPHI